MILNTKRINFSRDGGYLCASSNKGTVHVFNLQDQHFNRQIKLATLGFNSSNLFEARYSMCSFQIPCELPCICAFGDNCNSVICICVNGSCYKYMFTNDGKTCTRDSYENFLDLSLGSDFWIFVIFFFAVNIWLTLLKELLINI